MITPAIHDHLPGIASITADGDGARRLDLLKTAARLAEIDGLGQLNSTSLSKASGIDRRHIVQNFPTRSSLINAVWNYYVQEGQTRHLAEHKPVTERQKVQIAAGLRTSEPSEIRGGELKLADLLNDPLIAMVNRADRVNWRSYTQLIESAARVCSRAHPHAAGQRCEVNHRSTAFTAVFGPRPLSTCPVET